MAGLATASGAAVAQPQIRPRVPVVVAVPQMGCSTATVYNLEGTDGFLAVRAGPSVRERQMTRLYNGDDVFACIRRGNWFGIVFAPRGRAVECGVLRPWRAALAYTGPCHSGWVHYDYLSAYADFISP